MSEGREQQPSERMSLEIRTADLRDYDRLLPHFLGLREFSRAGHPPQEDDFAAVLAASREYLHKLLERGPECRTLVAEQAGQIAGYLVATVHDPNPLSSSGVVRSGSIDELFVDDAYRGLGAGSLLVNAACDWLVEQGARRVEVGAYAWNSAGIAFYEREGFALWTVTLAKPL